MMIIEEMTMKEFEEGLKRTRTVLIPFGSVEEHGYHLPLSTDTIQAYEVGKAAAILVPLFLAPPVHYGCCRSTACHPGTVSISTSTLQCLMKDIVKSFYNNGLRNFIILTGHAGGTHTMALLDAGEELLAEYGDTRIAVITEYDLAYEEGKGLIETEGDAHAGEIETSRILHLKPHLVKGSGKREFPQFPKGILVRDKRKYWKDGVWGDPGKATADKGRLIQELVVSKLVQFVKIFEQFQE